MNLRCQIPRKASSSTNASVILHVALGRVVPQISKPSPPMKSRIAAQTYQGQSIYCLYMPVSLSLWSCWKSAIFGIWCICLFFTCSPFSILSQENFEMSELGQEASLSRTDVLLTVLRGLDPITSLKVIWVMYRKLIKSMVIDSEKLISSSCKYNQNHLSSDFCWSIS